MTDTKEPTFSDPYFKDLYDRLCVVEDKLLALRKPKESDGKPA